MTNDAKRIVVIGGGVIGWCAAYFSAKRGHHVTVIERGSGEDGCSFGNAGMIVPSHFTPLAAPGMVALGLKWMWNPESPFWIKPRLSLDLLGWGLRFWRAANDRQVEAASRVLRDLHLASRADFEELADACGNEFGLVRRGLVLLCKTEHALEEEAKTAAAANALGVPAQVLNAAQTAALDPDVTMDVRGGVYFPKDCHLSPSSFMRSLKTMAEKLGARSLAGIEISGDQLVAKGRRMIGVKCGDEVLETDEIIVAAGAWSPALARAIGLRLPMQAGKGYSLTLPKPPQLPRLCSIFTEARVAVTPMGASLRVGGTMEIAGNDTTVDPRRVNGIVKALPAYFPEFRVEDFADVKPWAGLRPCSPDGLPYLGRSPRHENVIVAAGHSMMGLSLGPVTGRIVSEIASGEKPSINVAMLAVGR
ncbi:MAG: FAD-dependent oxidoreductase [Verrucomicrobiaceae bacterium]|nr:FAD-dependent oxidoreductase [Verrucomicrobiaceae bacterium]